jgi:4-amino-4-deoxy-L-arabinose transferase-like glycosyltransferase
MKNKTAYLFLAVAVIFFVLDTIQKLQYSPDDTFIYMQYARNISGGGGFSFNYGEPSYGITSPLWVIILSVSYFFGLSGFWFAKILDLICAVCSVIVFYRLAKLIFKDGNHFLAVLASSLFILNIWFIRWSFTGMETNLAVLSMLLIFYLYYKRNYALCFFLLGLFFLVRPEGIFLFIVILISLFIEKRKSVKQDFKNVLVYILLFLIPVVPFLIYAKITFGTFVPNTALGKSTLTLGFTIIQAQVTEIIKTLAPSSSIEIILGVLAVIYMLKKKLFLNYFALILWPFVLLFVYILTDSDIISRYFMIIIPVFTLLAVKSIEILSKKQFAAGISVFVLILIISQFSFYKFVKPHTDKFSQGVEECLIPIGKWFDENTPPGTRILVNDVGAIGYYSNRHIIDAAALVNRDLDMNKKIMLTPLEKRMNPYNLLEFVNADYVIERDSMLNDKSKTIDGKRLELVLYKIFPGLGISDDSPKYYKVYKITSY